MSSLRRQRVIEAIDAFLDEERSDIPPALEDSLTDLHNSLQRPPEEELSPGQLEVQAMTNGKPLERYSNPYSDGPTPGQLEAQQAAQNQDA